MIHHFNEKEKASNLKVRKLLAKAIKIKAKNKNWRLSAEFKKKKKQTMDQIKPVKEWLSKLDKSAPDNVSWNCTGAEVSSKDLYENNKDIIKIAKVVFSKTYEKELTRESMVLC